MQHKAYDVWVSIYNDKIQSTYEAERSELQKLSMIYCAFQNELDSLKDSLNNDICEIKAKLQRRDCLKKCKNFAGLAESEFFEIMTDNKENELPDNVPSTSSAINEVKTEDYITETPCFALQLPSHSKEPLSPVINKNHNQKKKSSGDLPLPLFTCNTEKTPNINGRKSDEFKTSLNREDCSIMDCSIIDDTPEIMVSKKNKQSKILHSKNSKSSRLKKSTQKTTLTQMLFSPKKKKMKREIDTNGPSMGITEIVDLVNQSSSDTDAELDQSDTTVDDLECNLIENSPEKGFKSFIENYDKVPEKKKESPDYVYKEVVRGKARKKLKGWSCEECEKYYKSLNLPPEELEKKKDECSKHRNKFKPNETYKGFWDLTFGPTPQSPDSETSMIFNIKKL